MSANTKQLKARLKSIKNTRKITKAMEMVAASKMKKVINKALATRAYSLIAWEIITKIAHSVARTHPLLKVRKVEKIGIVLISSNKGLCGSLNTQLIKKVFGQLEDPYNLMVNRVHGKRILPKIDPNDVEIDFISLGKKGENELVKNKKNLIATFNGFNERSNMADLLPVSKIIIDGYIQKKFDKVILAYTDFISTIVNKPRLRQVLPISREDLEKQIEELGRGIGEAGEMEEVKELLESRFYAFEPSKEKILDLILPKVVQVQVYQAFLESQAAEFSARMLTMKNASDTAGEMINEFNFKYNQARQAAITSELAEISAGMVALG